jgi:hypothetical protein
MSLLRAITSGFGSLFRKDQGDRELDEELRGFLQMAVEDDIFGRPDARVRQRSQGRSRSDDESKEGTSILTGPFPAT